ncbi:MAG: nucleoside triphosphate pyrophosphohydrolase [Anaerolineae bacterium]|nr:nucleoside triphosphate pyrophosphohydrolase [Anaerolineae bacterium]
MTITILGLGPGDPGALTRQAWDLLAQIDELHLRTGRHPTAAYLPAGLQTHTFDALYQELDDFDQVYEAIAARVLALGRRPGGVVYAVPGHPLVGESSVLRILARARDEGVDVRIVDGLSFIEPVLTALGLDALDGLQLADATSLASAHHPALDPGRPALVSQLYGRRLAGEVKLTLMNAYPDDHQVTLVRAAGTSDLTTLSLPLYELDRGDAADHLTTLYLPPLPGGAGCAALQETIAHLRAPDGCPWDREQTHQSLRENLLEETYEVLAALDAGDDDKLCEELGDLLMQIVMHAQISTEEGTFRLADVVRAINAKLRRRHPHVFGDVAVRDTAEVLANWEAIKSNERAEAAGSTAHVSRLAGVPTILPALARAQALGDRAARLGFDWPDAAGVLEKVGEEAAEIADAADPDAQARELGDLLFSLVNLARKLDVDAESALRATCDRFTRRYSQMEAYARARGLDLARMSLAEQDVLWEESKGLEEE